MKILLIGPMGVGKSTVAGRLATQLMLPLVDVDALRWEHFAQMPEYDNDKVEALFEQGEGEAAFAYMKPFEAKLVQALLAGQGEGVFDFGAGYTVYDDPALFSEVKEAFAGHDNVVLLRYSKDAEESLSALYGRHTDIPEDLYYALNRPFIESPCNGELAKVIIDTKGKTVEEVLIEVLCNIQ